MTKISAKVIKDSTNDTARITTVEIVMPRMILAECNTHRSISKNSASSRAIPVSKMLEKVISDPFIPYFWSKNQKGMAASELETDPQKIKELEAIWLRARDEAVDTACRLDGMGMHKQVVNRVLEPFMYHTVVATGTDWANFFKQRVSKSAEPHMALTAFRVYQAIVESKPDLKDDGYWHTPFIDEWENLDEDIAVKVSVARCARTSYLNHNGKRDAQEDLNLYERLMKGMHFSPMEHVAQSSSSYMGHLTKNFKGWIPYRSSIPNENWKGRIDLDLEDSEWLGKLCSLATRQ